MTLAMPLGFSDIGERKHFTKDTTGCSNSKSIYIYIVCVCLHVHARVYVCVIILVSMHGYIALYFTSIWLLPPPPSLSLSLTGVLKSLFK